MDLAEGHVAAVKYIQSHSISQNVRSIIPNSVYDTYTKSTGNGIYSVFNLGTGQGVSVLQMIAAMRKASGREIKAEITGRREGDIAVCYADTLKAKDILNWKATRSLDDMCSGLLQQRCFYVVSMIILLDLWNWQSKNPLGYSKSS